VYKFYATLLDTFHYYKCSEKETALEEFLASVNRTSGRSEAASKGTAFNELIDKVLSDPTQMERLKSYTAINLSYDYVDKEGLKTQMIFPTEIVKYFVDYFYGSVPQMFVEAPLQTSMGLVNLYGYMDEIRRDWSYDIKTTGQYLFPKFIDKYQHIVYPYCLHHMCISVSNFKYVITDFKEVFEEDYIYSPERDTNRLISVCNDLIEFIERPEIKSRVTNLKIYGLA